MNNEEKCAAVGRRIGRGLDQIREGLAKSASAVKQLRFDPNAQVETPDPTALLLDYFKENLSDIGFERVASLLEYADILRWAKANHKNGNQLFLVKGEYKESKEILLCVFFGVDNEPLLKSADAKKCYVFKTIPSGIQDLFGTSDLYVQPLK